ncbi:MAG: oxidoreductase C-terminal domain-containing protein, partial [Candidatus Puniceispirillum sp.]
QSAGLVPPPSASSRYIVRPGKRDGGFSVWSFDDKRLIAVEAVRDPASYMLGKTCLDRGLSPDLDKLGDPVFDLKAFVAGDK